MNRTTFRGTIRPAVVIALYCNPGMITTLPLATSAMHSPTTSPTSSHMNDGIEAISMPALVKLGADKDAEYVEERPDSSRATLATLMTVPAPMPEVGPVIRATGRGIRG